MATVNPAGNPFANPQSSNGYSPQLMEWLRRQALELEISRQAQTAIDQSSAFQPLNSALNAPVAPAVNPALAMPPGQAPIMPLPQAPVAAAQQPVQQAPAGPAPTFQAPAAPGPQAVQGPVPQAGPGVGAPAPTRQPAAGDLPPEIQKGPPVDDNDRANRLQGWREVVKRIKGDPSMQLALFRFGTQILQPVAPGQNPIGHFAGALQSGLDFSSAAAAAKVQQEQTRAQTATEQKRPDLVAAQTEATTAQAGATGATAAQTRAETERLVKMTPEEIKLNDAKIEALGADTNLSKEKIAALKADSATRNDPKYTAAIIEDLNARAWHNRNPQATASAAYKARFDFIEKIFPLILDTDATLQRRMKTDPQGATSAAKLQAADRWFSAGSKQAGVTASARAQLDVVRKQFESGALGAKGQTFEQYLVDQLENPLADQDMLSEMIRLYWEEKNVSGGAVQPKPAAGKDDPLGIRK